MRLSKISHFARVGTFHSDYNEGMNSINLANQKACYNQELNYWMIIFLFSMSYEN